MSYQTIVAAFDNAAQAQAAVEGLKAGGFHADEHAIDARPANAEPTRDRRRPKLFLPAQANDSEPLTAALFH
jgi:hypothetical protein